MAHQIITDGQAVLGVEFGSTRIKAVLTDKAGKVLAVGTHDWENHLENGLWTYSLAEIRQGLAQCYASLKSDVRARCGVTLTRLAGMGVSAMMHGYLAFDQAGELLTPFRTWRNTNTGKAAAELSEKLQFNIPLRWTSAHLYQAVLDREEHVPRLHFVTTLAGYVHYLLTGERVIGVGDASGIFPIDSETCDYDAARMAAYEALIAPHGYSWRASELFPRVLPAGRDAGRLTAEGAALLDPEGDLTPGVPLCPPEGDAGTGMVATNSVAVGTGNVSAGTSIFAMVVTSHALSKPWPELDMVTTPDGMPCAMVHCNNCTSDLNAWIGLFREFAETAGLHLTMDELFALLYHKAMEGEKDCGGLVSYPFLSGEPVAGLTAGVPMLLREPDAKMSLSTFMRTHLCSCFAVLKMGMDLLLKEEKLTVTRLTGHGGLFKTRGVAQALLAGAVNAPITVMENAGEGGAWGIALLAAYRLEGGEQPLGEWLNQRIFVDVPGTSLSPDAADVAGFEQYMTRFRQSLCAQKAVLPTEAR
ncbi:MAG: FGGY-family carbohydrate kinase [Eubacteriales bacterium]|nr:FGGY-family carbohydrate kinase [Eubacteriales bacterium]